MAEARDVHFSNLKKGGRELGKKTVQSQMTFNNAQLSDWRELELNVVKDLTKYSEIIIFSYRLLKT